MFKGNKIKKILLGVLGASAMVCNNAALALRYAKVTLIGPKCTGKTTLHRVVTGFEGKIESNLPSTKEISSQEVLIKHESEDIISYFWDVPGAEDMPTHLLKEFREDSNVAMIMINVDQVHDEKTGLFNNCSYTSQFIRDLLKECPKCKIIFGVIRLKDENDPLFKNEVTNYVKNVLCAGELQSRVAGWLELPNIGVLNSKEGRVACKEEVLGLIKKAIEMYGVDNLPKTSKNLHAKLEMENATRLEDNWVEEPDGTNACGGNKTKRVNRPKKLIVGERLVLKKW